MNGFGAPVIVGAPNLILRFNILFLNIAFYLVRLGNDRLD